MFHLLVSSCHGESYYHLPDALMLPGEQIYKVHYSEKGRGVGEGEDCSK